MAAPTAPGRARKTTGSAGRRHQRHRLVRFRAHQGLPEEPPHRGPRAPWPRRGPRPREAGTVRRIAARRAVHQAVRGSPRSGRRRHRVDHDAQPPPRRPGRGRRARGQTLRPREAHRPRHARAGAHPRRRAQGEGADDRVLRAALQPVPPLRALDAAVRPPGPHPLRARAVPLARDRLVLGVGVGAQEVERPQPPPGRGLPRRGRPALVLGPGAASR